jgi:hypothetical protein
MLNENRKKQKLSKAPSKQEIKQKRRKNREGFRF